MEVYLLIEKSCVSGLEPNETYRKIILNGVTYNESQFKEWGYTTWNVPKGESIGRIVERCKGGGWVVFKLTRM